MTRARRDSPKPAGQAVSVTRDDLWAPSCGAVNGASGSAGGRPTFRTAEVSNKRRPTASWRTRSSRSACGRATFQYAVMTTPTAAAGSMSTGSPRGNSAARFRGEGAQLAGDDRSALPPAISLAGGERETSDADLANVPCHVCQRCSGRNPPIWAAPRLGADPRTRCAASHATVRAGGAGTSRRRSRSS
jgi:hypothetical protein